MKNVQIPQDLLFDLFRYFLDAESLDDFEEAELVKSITDALNHKLDALVKHDLYTRSKTADTPQERENARQAYLDAIGMRQSYRWAEGHQDGPQDD